MVSGKNQKQDFSQKKQQQQEKQNQLLKASLC